MVGERLLDGTALDRGAWRTVEVVAATSVPHVRLRRTVDCRTAD
ncbi:hypothetical protein [Geodermatophilus sp. URMC 62]